MAASKKVRCLDELRAERGPIGIGAGVELERDPGQSTAPIDDQGGEQTTPLMQDIAHEVAQRL